MRKNKNLTKKTPAANGCGEEWFAAAGGAPAKAVVVLTHGLNLRPARMNDLARALARDGFEVFRPAFCGHNGDTERFLSVSAEEWAQDARRIHAEAMARALELGVPLHLGAYSFSALVFQVLSPELPFARRIFFAPALRTHFWYPAAMGVARLLPNLRFTSRIFPDYRANSTTGTRALIALHEFMRRWRRGEGAGESSPTLIWIDPRDELVSGRKLRKLAAQKPGWELRELSNRGSRMRVKYHHLIINEEALGTEEWERLVRETREFLGR